MEQLSANLKEKKDQNSEQMNAENQVIIEQPSENLNAKIDKISDENQDMGEKIEEINNTFYNFKV